jgi:hypothetical protein
VLGSTWWETNGFDVRLLTDTEEKRLNRETALRFAQKGQIKTLRGIHAKLYIADDSVLLTSANLTVTAFTRKYEAGIVLKGAAGKSAVSLFELWWEHGKNFSISSVMELPRKHLKQTGEENPDHLPEPSGLPPDPGSFGGPKFVQLFGDYSDFLKSYRRLATDYDRVPRLWPDIPLYLEIDAFLDFLFHHGQRPSKPYTKLPPRSLTPEQIATEIRKWANKFQTLARREWEHDGKWRKTNAQRIRRLLSANRVMKLRRSEIEQIAGSLNCMGDRRVLNRFLRGNTIATVRNAWAKLIFGADKDLPIDEMSECASVLYGFKRSSVQELLGWYMPTRFPLRNRNVNAGMRFLGFDTPVN